MSTSASDETPQRARRRLGRSLRQDGRVRRFARTPGEARSVLIAAERTAVDRIALAVVDAGLTVAGTANDADAALELASDLRAGLCVVALSPPTIAHALLEEIIDAVPASRVVLLASENAPDAFVAAMRSGAAGYLLDADHVTLVAALGDVAQGRSAISEALLPALLAELRAG